MPNETTYKRGARVWMINCMGVPNEAAEVVRQMPADYPLKNHAEWWLLRFADSPKSGGLYVHQSQIAPQGANGGPLWEAV
jgi:hypothetical protein